jgi:hypothetical protein
VLESHIYAVQAAPIHDAAALVAALSAQARALAVVSADANSNAFFDTSLLAVAPAPGCCVRRALGSRKDVVHQRLESREDREQREQAVGGVDTVSSAGKAGSSHGKPKIVKHLSDSKAIEAFFAKPTAGAPPLQQADAAAERLLLPQCNCCNHCTAASNWRSSPSSSKRSAPVKKAKSGPMEAFFKASAAKTPVESKPVVQAVATDASAEAIVEQNRSPRSAAQRSVERDCAVAKAQWSTKQQHRNNGVSEVVVDDPSSAKKRLRRRQVVESDDEDEPAGVSSSLPTMSRSASIMTQDSTSASAQRSVATPLRTTRTMRCQTMNVDDDAGQTTKPPTTTKRRNDGDDKAASTTTTTTAKEKKPKKPKAPVDPNRPKRPANAFFLYRNDNLERVKSENAEMSAKEIDKKLRDDWKEADADTKKQYADKSKAAIAAWKTAADAYDAANNAKPASKGDSQNEDEEAGGGRRTTPTPTASRARSARASAARSVCRKIS